MPPGARDRQRALDADSQLADARPPAPVALNRSRHENGQRADATRERLVQRQPVRRNEVREQHDPQGFRPARASLRGVCHARSRTMQEASSTSGDPDLQCETGSGRPRAPSEQATKFSPERGYELSDLGVSPGPASLAEYAAIVWRRKLLVLPILICVPLIAVGVLSFQKAEYQASADVLLRTDSLSSAANANQDPTAAAGHPGQARPPAGGRRRRHQDAAISSCRGGSSSRDRRCPQIRMPTS